MFRSSLYSILAHSSPHSLITVHILSPSKEDDDGEEIEEMAVKPGVGIKVATFPGEIRGCVIVKADDHVQAMGLLPGDRLVVADFNRH